MRNPDFPYSLVKGIFGENVDWDDFPDNPREIRKLFRTVMLSALTPEEMDMMWTYYSTKASRREIGEKYGVSSEHVRWVMYLAARKLKHPKYYRQLTAKGYRNKR